MTDVYYINIVGFLTGIGSLLLLFLFGNGIKNTIGASAYELIVFTSVIFFLITSAYFLDFLIYVFPALAVLAAGKMLALILVLFLISGKIFLWF